MRKCFFCFNHTLFYFYKHSDGLKMYKSFKKRQEITSLCLWTCVMYVDEGRLHPQRRHREGAAGDRRKPEWAGEDGHRAGEEAPQLWRRSDESTHTDIGELSVGQYSRGCRINCVCVCAFQTGKMTRSWWIGSAWSGRSSWPCVGSLNWSTCEYTHT